MKALVIVHRHPDFSVGGAEIAAYNHFKALLQRSDVSEATFLARTDMTSIDKGQIRMHRSGEYLWRQGIADWLMLRTAQPEAIVNQFRNFLNLKQPSIVYVHHFGDIGIEILREIRQTLPGCKLILTLHEFVPICHRNGQMVKNKTNRLCWRESIDDCHICFPEYRPEDFWLRKHYIQRHFEMCDRFVAPSDFLMQRYIAWGVPDTHISVIENGQPDFSQLHRNNPTTTANSRVRFGFFGQITPYKGLDILLQALHLCPVEVRRSILVEIHGANLELQSEEFRALIEKLRIPLIGEGVLRWVGGYEPSELHRRMSKVDWVVVPSIWWENSPMVIQEAFCCRRPVICGNAGGMGEKVQHEVNGLHFEIRNPLDLADTLARTVSESDLWARLVANIQQPMSYNQSAEAYLRLATA